MNTEDLVEHLRIMARPIDYNKLERDGIVEKSGSWYLIHKQDELPEHVVKNSNAVRTKDGTLHMKFDSHVKYAAVLKKAGVGSTGQCNTWIIQSNGVR